MTPAHSPAAHTAPEVVDLETHARASMRRHLARRPTLAEDGANVAAALAHLGRARSYYTSPRDPVAATRARLFDALWCPSLRTLHHAALLLAAHGDWARAALWRARASGVARTWGVDSSHLDKLLADAGVPPAGEQAEMFGREGER